MNAVGFKNGGHVQRHVLSFPDAALFGRLRHMTVGAPDLTLGNLFKDRFPNEPRPRHRRNASPFVAKVVELQNHRVALAAINAWVRCQVLPHAKLVLFRASRSHLLDVRKVLLPVS
jgi:hypothetical protein